MHDGVREVPAYADCPTNPEVELKLMTCSIGGEFDEANANADVGIVFRDGQLAEHLLCRHCSSRRCFL